jgi:hypothetical protein
MTATAFAHMPTNNAFATRDLQMKLPVVASAQATPEKNVKK